MNMMPSIWSYVVSIDMTEMMKLAGSVLYRIGIKVPSDMEVE